MAGIYQCMRKKNPSPLQNQVGLCCYLWLYMCVLEMFPNSLKLTLIVIIYLIDIPKYYDAFWRKANMHLECLLLAWWHKSEGQKLETLKVDAGTQSKDFFLFLFHYIIFQTPYNICECAVSQKILKMSLH